MNWRLMCRMLGLLSMLVGGAMVFGLPWAFPQIGPATTFEFRGFWALTGAIACSLALGGVLFSIGRNETGPLLRKEALAVVGLGWILVGVLGSLPFLFANVMISENRPMTVIDALFESISGFTTTGATVLTELEDPALVPRCVLFWRSFTHWLGGMGIIVLFVALLGHLGPSAKALMRREVRGPIAESIRPRVRETALVMWGIYLTASAILTVLLLIERMDIYDALCHAFAVVSTGAFTTHNESIAYFESPAIEITLIVFMILAGTNFSLYHAVFRRDIPPSQRGPFRRLIPLYRDPEFKVYLLLLLIASTILAITLIVDGQYDTISEVIRHSVFQAVAMMTTVGLRTEDFAAWNEFAEALMLLLMFIGGCAGSTAGGLKVVRIIVFFKICRVEIEHAFRPNVVRSLRLANMVVDNVLRHNVQIYLSLVLVTFMVSWLLLVAIEPNDQWLIGPVGGAEVEQGPAAEVRRDQYTDLTAQKIVDCASAITATLNNVGPGLGALGPISSYSGFSVPGKLLLILMMLLGRLEFFAIITLLVPSFWRTQ